MEPRALSAAMLALCVTLGVLSGCGKSPDTATPSTTPHTSTATAVAPQATFATPDEAVAALIAAGDDNQALQRLLGPGTKELLSSGDPVADRRAREAFRERYQAYHELVAGSPNDLVLLVGEDRWPLPVPLVRRDGRWSWDGAAGARELVTRRIGANELRTIDVMRGFVEAERDYAAEGHDGGKPGVYAQKLRSSPGKHDGLYWEVSAAGRPSPAGPLLAAANSEGYAGGGADAPYHGYLFKILTSQGPEANGGARSYIADGKLTGGFALLGYPVSYRVSGVMTFLVNQDGVVWQRDLGPDTATAAAAITQFNPDNSWTPLAPEG
jgi:Protein of unknown function (DUF2950)